MTKLFIYLSVAVVLSVAVWSVEGLRCLPCPPDPCEPPTGCEYGVGRWACMCCDGCLLGPGEKCGGPWNIYGICGEGLECEMNPPIDFNSDGVCVVKRKRRSTTTTTSTTTTDLPQEE